jgi:hypothetical protein
MQSLPVSRLPKPCRASAIKSTPTADCFLLQTAKAGGGLTGVGGLRCFFIKHLETIRLFTISKVKQFPTS